MSVFDEDIDTAAIEEEDQIEYIWRSTNAAEENESSQFPLLDQSTQKDELETRDENCTTPTEKVDR